MGFDIEKRESGAPQRQLWHRHHAFGEAARQSCGALRRVYSVTVNTTSAIAATHEADRIQFAPKAQSKVAQKWVPKILGAPSRSTEGVERSGDRSWSAYFGAVVRTGRDMLMAPVKVCRVAECYKLTPYYVLRSGNGRPRGWPSTGPTLGGSGPKTVQVQR